MNILYENNGFYIVRNEKGRMSKIPKNKFKDGEIVAISNEHYSYKALSMLTKPSFTKNRGWVYVENYMNLQEIKGGCGMWNEENLYKKIDNPILKLYAERIQIKKEIENHEAILKKKRNELEKIEFSLSLSVDNWNNIEKMCKCGKLFIKNSKNVNFDYCDSCDPELLNDKDK